MPAPLLLPVRDACEQSKCEGFELGPSLFVFTPVCEEEGVEEFCIGCHEQRNDSQMSFSQNSIEIPNQCSTVTTMRPGGLTIQYQISLGSAICRPEVQAAVFNVAPQSDGEAEDCTYIEYQSRPSNYRHWQVAAIPYDGTELSREFGFVLYYAVIMPENATLNFSPSAPREMAITVKAEPHPQTQALGRSLFGCADLLNRLSSCAEDN